MKECDYEKCPYCGEDIAEYIDDETNLLGEKDAHHIENGQFSIQAEWKELYRCPNCGKIFYIICQH